MESQNRKLSVGDYLLHRLKEIGLDTIFGVPGDFLLGFLDRVLETQIKYVGTCNELNAAYAADGYARVKGIGALAVTYGVGELSAINGIGGAYAEHVPVIVIVGSPPTDLVKQDKLLHHRIGSWDSTKKIFEHVTAYSAILTDPAVAAKHIDQALTDCLKLRLPVYLSIPSDIVNQPCADKVPSPLFTSLNPSDIWKSTEESNLRNCVDEFLHLFKEASKPVVIVDGEIQRFRQGPMLKKFLEASGAFFCSTPLGKCIMDESSENFLGLYSGRICQGFARDFVENIADLVIWIGPHMSDFNTGGFSTNISSDKLILLCPFHSKVKDKHYDNTFFGSVLEELTSIIPTKEYHESLKLQLQGLKKRVHFESDIAMRITPEAMTEHAREGKQSQTTAEHSMPKNAKLGVKYLIQQIAQTVPPHSLFFVDTGVTMFNTHESRFPEDTIYISQNFYSSIGYTIGACLGAGIADRTRPFVLVIGDGSFQVTCQDVSTMIRYGLRGVIFVVNNEGYLIERTMDDNKYNDIQNWDYSKTLEYFGGKEFKNNEWKASTKGELAEALHHVKTSLFSGTSSTGKSEAETTSNQVFLVEARVGKYDCSSMAQDSGKHFAEKLHIKKAST